MTTGYKYPGDICWHDGKISQYACLDCWQKIQNELILLRRVAVTAQKVVEQNNDLSGMEGATDLHIALSDIKSLV